jgi:cell division protein FtsL
MARGKRNNRQIKMQRINYQQEYMYGSAAPLPDYQPQEVPRKEKIKSKPPKGRLNPQIKRNRRRAQNVSTGYSIYLLAVSVIVVAICIFYLQLQSGNIRRANDVNNLRTQLTEITEQNNTAYQSISRSIDIDYIRIRAIEELGMISVTPEMVIEYQNPSSSYVILHHEIPITGIVAP